MHHIVGWDIGGAHLKAALVQPEAKILAVYQEPCELWKGLDKLEFAVNCVLAQIPVDVEHHAITMTGELVDLFPNRHAGVSRIVATMCRLLPGKSVTIYAGNAGFIAANEVNHTHYDKIASANWLASASWVAKKVINGLFVDIGSTTTDILLLREGLVHIKGYSDYERLISQELVYTGIVRTPVMAIAQCVSDQGREVGLMAEYFATMADVYRVTGELKEVHDQTPTADGAEKTVSASAKRLSRMIGSDFYEHELTRWLEFAHDLKSRQLAKIAQACERQLLSSPNRSEHLPIVGAGVGRFLVAQLAAKMERPYVDFSELLVNECANSLLAPADCAPAVAVGCLAAK